MQIIINIIRYNYNSTVDLEYKVGLRMKEDIQVRYKLLFLFVIRIVRVHYNYLHQAMYIYKPI